ILPPALRALGAGDSAAPQLPAPLLPFWVRGGRKVSATQPRRALGQVGAASGAPSARRQMRPRRRRRRPAAPGLCPRLAAAEPNLKRE
uniref:Uncharacterized protein n=2 Tax=Canis lupus familiaris TaxID=9615 RepID=A0A8C0NBX7_CANLF